MQILYDHQIFSWQKYGGISRYFYEIIERTSQEKDCNIDLFQGFHINKYGLEQNKITYKNYISIPRKMILKMGRLFNLLNKMMLYKFSSNQIYDIYHPTYYKTFSLKKRHLIVTVYDMIHEIFYNDFHDRIFDAKKQ